LLGETPDSSESREREKGRTDSCRFTGSIAVMDMFLYFNGPAKTFPVTCQA